jgi:hypothetical protein
MKSSERKLRGGSKSVLTKLKALCLKKPEVTEQIMQHMNQAAPGGAPPTSSQIRQYIGEHFNIQLQWDSQFSSWLSWVNLSRKTEQREIAIEEWLRNEAALHPELSEEDLNQRGQRKFKLLSIAEEQPSDWARILREEYRQKKLVQDDKRIGLEDRRIKILERKAEAFDKAQEVVKSSLSPEEQRERLKKILA